jgi:hypothetical protein
MPQLNGLRLKPGSTKISLEDLHKLFDSRFINHIAQHFPPEFKSIVDMKAQAATEWPQPQDMEDLPVCPHHPGFGEDPKDPTVEERMAMVEWDIEKTIWSQTNAIVLKHRKETVREHEKKRQPLYGLIANQLHPDVLRALRDCEAGAAAQEVSNMDALQLVQGLRSLAIGNPTSSTEAVYRDSLHRYERCIQGNLPLPEYYDTFVRFYRALVTAAAEENARRGRPAEGAKEDADADDDASTVGGSHKAPAVTIEDQDAAGTRFVEGLSYLIPKAFKNVFEYGAVIDFRRDFLQSDPRKREEFRADYGGSFEHIFASIREAVFNRRSNPTSADINSFGANQTRGLYLTAAKNGCTSQDARDSQKNVKKPLKKTADRTPTPSKTGRPAAPIVKDGTCSACNQAGHWWRDGVCDVGRKWLSEKDSDETDMTNDQEDITAAGGGTTKKAAGGGSPRPQDGGGGRRNKNQN